MKKIWTNIKKYGLKTIIVVISFLTVLFLILRLLRPTGKAFDILDSIILDFESKIFKIEKTQLEQNQKTKEKEDEIQKQKKKEENLYSSYNQVKQNNDRLKAKIKFQKKLRKELYDDKD